MINICRVIASSHPVCNTIMLFGVIICLASVVLLGIDGRFVDAETYPQVSGVFDYIYLWIAILMCVFFICTGNIDLCFVELIFKWNQLNYLVVY